MARGNQRDVTAQEREAIRRRYNSGFPVRQIAAEFNRCESAVWNACKGLRRIAAGRGVPVTASVQRVILAMRAGGSSLAEVADALNLSERSVSKWSNPDRVPNVKSLTATVKTAGTGGSVLAAPVPAAQSIKISLRVPEHVMRMVRSLTARGVSEAEAVSQAMRFYARDKAGSAVEDRGISRAAGGGVVAPFHAQNMTETSR